MFSKLALRSLRNPKQIRNFSSVNGSSSSRYASVNDKDLAFFEQVLTSKNVIVDSTELESMNLDW